SRQDRRLLCRLPGAIAECVKFPVRLWLRHSASVRLAPRPLPSSDGSAPDRNNFLKVTARSRLPSGSIRELLQSGRTRTANYQSDLAPSRCADLARGSSVIPVQLRRCDLQQAALEPCQDAQSYFFRRSPLRGENSESPPRDALM